MLSEATKNARIAANEFAKINKDVRVVTTITFYLTN